MVVADAEVPRLGNTTSAVPPNMNKLPVVGQTPFDAKGSAPQDTPTPLAPLDDKRPPIPLQVYQTDRAFFGSAPVGGLEILTSKIPHSPAASNCILQFGKSVQLCDCISPKRSDYTLSFFQTRQMTASWLSVLCLDPLSFKLPRYKPADPVL